MDLTGIVGGHITAKNIGEVVKTAKSVFLESGHETSKGEGRAKLYNFFKGEMENIKATLTKVDDKGNKKPKYAVLKKFLVGEGIFKNNAHYDRAMVSINHFNRSVVKLAKLETLQKEKEAFEVKLEACKNAEERGELLKQKYIEDEGKDAEANIAKRDAKRQATLKHVLALSNIDNLRTLHREDIKAIGVLASVLAQYTKENVKSATA